MGAARSCLGLRGVSTRLTVGVDAGMGVCACRALLWTGSASLPLPECGHYAVHLTTVRTPFFYAIYEAFCLEHLYRNVSILKNS